jgi:hypothetical protein
MESQTCMYSSSTGAVVHIGPHKTGSTTVQVGLRAISQLITSHGFSLPPDPTTDRPNSVPKTIGLNYFAMELMGLDRHPWMGWKVPSRVSAILDWLKKCDGNPILSAEEFSMFDSSHVGRLASLLPPNSSCVIFSRSYDSLSSSLWAQLVFSGVESRSLSRFQQDYIHILEQVQPREQSNRSEVDLPRTRITNLVNIWKKHFKIRIVSPDFLNEIPEVTPIQAMLRALGIDLLKVESQLDANIQNIINLRKNSRTNPESIYQLLQLNRARGTSEPYLWANERRRIRSNSSTIEKMHKNEIVEDFEPSSTACKRLRNLYEQDVSELSSFVLS